MVLELDIELENKIKEISDKKNCTVNSLVIEVLQEYLEDKIDSKIIMDYEKRVQNKTSKGYTKEDLEKIHGIDLTNFDDIS